LVVALAVLVYGLSQWHWYLVEMGALFVILAIVLAAIARMSPDRTAVVHGISLPLRELPGALSAIGMFFVQSLANLFIPSGSGQAYVTMPIMAPLADLVDVSRQVAVLAYQFGDGFTNILVPTNAVLVGILAMAAIPYDRWVRFVFPFMVKMWVLGSIALAVAVAIGYA
jgi:uncharacterized ion transporter superfamily protein YfcC